MKFILLFLIFTIAGCNASGTKQLQPVADTVTAQEVNASVTDTVFNPSHFPIMNGQLGSITIGMTIAQAEAQFRGLDKKTDHASNFGFGGGSPAYLYYEGEKVVLGLIPTFGTDTVLIIIAADRRLQTGTGLNPNATVKELMDVYPRMYVNQDLMNGWEFFQDTVNEWDFVFMTGEENRIGSYPEIEVPSRPKRIDVAADWVSIRKLN